MSLSLTFEAPPHAFCYMAKALLPKRTNTFSSTDAPGLSVEMRNFVPKQYSQKYFGDHVHPVEFAAAGIRLIMTLLTHPLFPYRIWNVLQLSNEISQYRAILPNESLLLAARFEKLAAVSKGLEYTVNFSATSSKSESDLAFENRVKFFVRTKQIPSESLAKADPHKQADPPSPSESVAQITRDNILPYCRLTGDYNGIHAFDLYARSFGFRASFSHPHRALTSCMNQIPSTNMFSPLRLEALFKGPVYYNTDCNLTYTQESSHTRFALRVLPDPRPAIIGTLSYI